ncbi:MAG: hypothetical protein F6K28_28020 [Microcoleus sp. SIO2G3]|nr:hypothetical protein [Microcoleus sp. SIO2G3]
MAPQKLSDSDKQAILDLYRHSDETSSTLAARYGVSNTTISRILKLGLAEEEYEALIQRKRIAGRTQPATANISVASAVSDRTADLEVAPAPESPIAVPVADVPAVEPVAPVAEPVASDKPRRRSRSSVAAESPPVSEPEAVEVAEVATEVIAPTEPKPQKRVIEAIVESEPPTAPSHFDEDDEDDDDLDDDDLDDDDLDDEDDDDDGLAAVQVQSKSFIQVLPLTEAAMPKTCYLVVDRASELITRPLRDFAELGQIPTEEVQAKTLPIFDNHRVARRFSRRMQRVVKVPDSKVITKVSSYLQAKGITRLLIDGQVYSL